MDRLSEEDNLTEDKVKIIIRQVAEAIAYTHLNNVTHRDVSPNNIFFTSKNPNDYSVKLSGYRYAVGNGIKNMMFNPG
jgi:serine/threonine protein kinase